MGRLGMVEQASIGQRLKFICQQTFDGNTEKLAMALGCKHQAIKMVIGGKIVSHDYFQLLLTRLPRLGDLCDVEWIRTGQGKPYGDKPPSKVIDAFEDRKNGVVMIDHPIVPPPPATNGANGKHEGPPDTPLTSPKPTIVQILTRHSERLDRLEKTWAEAGHEIRSLARKQVAEDVEAKVAEAVVALDEKIVSARLEREKALDDIRSHVRRVDTLYPKVTNLEQQVALLTATNNSLAEKLAEALQRIAALDKSIEFATRRAGEANMDLRGVKEKAEALDAHNTNLEGRILKIEDRLGAFKTWMHTIEDALTRPGTLAAPQEPPPKPRREADLDPGELMTATEYLAREFEPADWETRDALLDLYEHKSEVLTAYLTLAVTILADPWQKKRQGRLNSKYTMRLWRILRAFLVPANRTDAGKYRRQELVLHLMRHTTQVA